uniref:Uncharacterized protein n=1 Tax=Candidozyma auris TaxID=498019 RepID=A0A0L0P8Y5_CANAR
MLGSKVWLETQQQATNCFRAYHLAEIPAGVTAQAHEALLIAVCPNTTFVKSY